MPFGKTLDWHKASFWYGLVYIVFPLSLLLYGVNDIVDAEGDRYNPRKGTYLFGSRGGDQQLLALRWQIATSQMPFLYLFWGWCGPRIFLWFGALLLAVYFYNARPIALKGRPPFDVLIQASYLLIFILSSWLNRLPQLPWQTFIFGALFAMHSHVFGEVMDIEPDQKSGRRTLATQLSRVPAKFFIAALLLIECALVHHYFSDLVITAFLAVGALFFLADALLLWRNRAYSPSQMRLFLWGWNLAAILGIVWNELHGSLLAVRSGT